MPDTEIATVLYNQCDNNLAYVEQRLQDAHNGKPVDMLALASIVANTRRSLRDDVMTRLTPPF